MTKEDLKIKLIELFPQFTTEIPSATIDESGTWLKMNISKEDFLNVVTQLKTNLSFHFDFLFCLTCIDWKTHLTMVYHFTSTTHRQPLVLQITLDREHPEIETVSSIWRTAEFHEREVYEMFGVNFLHHPDLRLLILPDGWENKRPMLKDFEDPINMIKL
ncbi:MAG: NADH-quinone oxidoreductase subunit C [Chitinophagaceae bacterium]|nr:MAG: NADH-quinone oxidoreductase subunit C [Chitinophagaceae bacterium]